MHIKRNVKNYSKLIHICAIRHNNRANTYHKWLLFLKGKEEIRFKLKHVSPNPMKKEQSLINIAHLLSTSKYAQGVKTCWTF